MLRYDRMCVPTTLMLSHILVGNVSGHVTTLPDMTHDYVI